MRIEWRGSGPLISPPEIPGERVYSIKDPSVIRFAGSHHLFATIRAEERSHRLLYLRFPDLERPEPTEQAFLDLGTDMIAAPQVFLHRRDGRFFLVFQAKGPFPYGPAYSANETLDPKGWSDARPLYERRPEPVERWLDFWVIRDGDRTFLFFTSLDGKMWRAETATERFPEGFGAPVVALEADLFEAGHIYRLQDRFLCIVEAKRMGRRYQRLFAADRLDGEWRDAGVFASAAEVTFDKERWTDSISHGELLRAGAGERMELRPGPLCYLFQGARDLQVIGRPYGRVPWRIGLLHAVGVDEILRMLR